MKISGGEAVVKSLAGHDVKVVYGLPGSQILDIYNSLRDETRIKSILAMHEINAAFMADAHGRLTGEPGVCVVTGGPGATNAVTGIAQAYTDASPVVQITGHTSTGNKTQPNHCVDDLDFLLKIYQPLTKWSVRIEKVEDIPPILEKAFTLAISGRPGPVHVEIPRDILARSVELHRSRPLSRAETPDIAPYVNEVAEILKSAANPLIAVGKGVQREFCSDEVTKLAESLGAPILTLPSSLSAISYECPLYIGYDLSGIRWMLHPHITELIKEADIILTLGCDLGERLRFFGEEDERLIHIHQDALATADSETASHVSRPVFDVVASIKDFVTSLENKIGTEHSPIANVKGRISKIKKKIREDITGSIEWGSKPIHPGEIGTKLRRVLDDDAILALDVGDSSEWMKICYRAKVSNTILAPGRYSAMGFSLPAAIAAKINYPERQVVAVTGDGGFLMSYMAFPTLVKYGLGVIVAVESNRRYGMIWNMQRTNYRGRTFATEIEIPNFADYARAFGATGIKVMDPKDLKGALEEAVNVKGPVLVDIDTAYQFPPYMPTRIRRLLRRIKHLGSSSSD